MVNSEGIPIMNTSFRDKASYGNTGEIIPYCSEKYKQFICTNFDRIK